MYARTDASEFITCMKNAGFEVYVYTSIMRQNAVPILSAVLPDHPELTINLFDRPYNKKDREGANYWDTIRDMGNIWSYLPDYGPHNTVILDDSAHKYRDFPQNLIEIEHLTEDQILSKTRGTLDTVGVYLTALSKAAPNDVRKYLKENRFGAEKDTRSDDGKSTSDSNDNDGRNCDSNAQEEKNDENKRLETANRHDDDDHAEKISALDSLLQGLHVRSD